MQPTSPGIAPVLLLAAALTVHPLLSGEQADPRQERSSAEGTVRELYELVTFGPGSSPDWGRVRSLFAGEAVILLRTTRDSTRIFSVEGFVEDFAQFAARPRVQERGFQERIVRLQSTEFGDLANVLVLYEASIPGWERPPQRGVDAFLLRREKERWTILAIANEIVTAERPPPPELGGE